MPRRVLIADHHSAIVRLLSRMLERLGYEPVALAMRDPGPTSAPPRGVRPTALPREDRPAPAPPREDRPTPALLRSADVLLIEPTAPGALALAHTARAANPTLTVIGEGAMPPGRGERERWLRVAAPVGYLAKPFTSAQLDAALQQGLAHGDSLRRGAGRDGDVGGRRKRVGV